MGFFPATRREARGAKLWPPSRRKIDRDYDRRTGRPSDGAIGTGARCPADGGPTYVGATVGGAVTSERNGLAMRPTRLRPSSTRPAGAGGDRQSPRPAPRRAPLLRRARRPDFGPIPVRRRWRTCVGTPGSRVSSKKTATSPSSEPRSCRAGPRSPTIPTSRSGSVPPFERSGAPLDNERTMAIVAALVPDRVAVTVHHERIVS